MTDKLKVKRYEQTCWACPSQWDIFLENGDYVYARFRFGYLSLTLNSREAIFGLEQGSGFDGVMSTSELMELTKDILDWSNV